MAKIYRVIQIELNQLISFRKCPHERRLTDNSVFKRCHSDKHLSEFILQDGAHMEQKLRHCHPGNSHTLTTTGWRRGVVVCGVRRMNEVNACRARLVPGWVTVFGRVYNLGM